LILSNRSALRLRGTPAPPQGPGRARLTLAA